MLDTFNREINYLRVSVTDRCNLRCSYCMPDEGIVLKKHSEIITFEEIVGVIGAAVKLGISKIRLTGGEPLVRRGIVDLVRMIAAIDGVNELGMTTNGVILDRYAMELKNAGLSRINISLDSLNPDRYRKITQVGSIDDVLKGIDAANSADLPIKINKVVLPDDPPYEIDLLYQFCNKNGYKLQLIKHFDLTEKKFVQYHYDRPHNCNKCNRIRLLADGKLKPCLHSNQEIDIDFNNIEKSLIETIKSKPESGTVCDSRGMSQIGG